MLEEQGILLVLADKAVMTFWIDSLDPSDAVGAAKRARKISSHASFFKVGDCLGRRLVCVVKSGSVSSTIKALEPADAHPRGKKQPAIRKFLQGSNDALRVFKVRLTSCRPQAQLTREPPQEFYIPTESSSVHFLKSKLCVGCTKGFEIVDLESLDTQGLLDPADSSLDFVQKRENVRPVAIYRVEGEFLLCYDDFAFYVNKNGWRARSNWLIQWEGHPTAFGVSPSTKMALAWADSSVQPFITLMCWLSSRPSSRCDTWRPALSCRSSPDQIYGKSCPFSFSLSALLSIFDP